MGRQSLQVGVWIENKNDKQGRPKWGASGHVGVSKRKKKKKKWRKWGRKNRKKRIQGPGMWCLGSQNKINKNKNKNKKDQENWASRLCGRLWSEWGKS